MWWIIGFLIGGAAAFAASAPEALRPADDLDDELALRLDIGG